MTYLVVQIVKNLPAMQETRVQSLLWEIPWRRKKEPTPVFWPAESHGLYRPWGRKESDTTESRTWLSDFHTMVIIKKKYYNRDYRHTSFGASLIAQLVKNPPAMQEIPVWFLGREDPLEKGKATKSSILAWRIPWSEEPGGLQSMGSWRVGYYWATNTHL